MAGKRILIFTNHFYPEEFRVNDVAFDLSEKGHSVTVLSCIPNYPKGVYFEGYGLLKKRKEIVRGVKIIRVPHIPRGDGTGKRLILNYGSYAFCLSIWAFFVSLINKYDIVLVHHTSPIFLGLPAVWVKKKQKSKLIFWNLDLWPESVTAAGNVNNKIILNLLNKIVKYIYSNSDRILISSKGFWNSIISKGIDFAKIEYFPNWAEDIFTQLNTKESFQIESRFNQDKYFKILFAGNIGEAQDMENIYEAILLTSGKNSNIKWIFVGDGRKAKWLKDKVNGTKLSQVVEFLGRKPIKEMPYYIEFADIMLLPLKNEPIFAYTIPAKVQAYMASEKPILAMINGESQNLINEAKCGLTVNAGDFVGLAENALKFSQMDKEEIKIMGKNGKEFYLKNFSKNLVLKKLYQIINN
jgi:glycosyltransferase involved in cell wall biosynthesis